MGLIGNILTSALMAIFSQLLGIDWKEKINFDEWWDVSEKGE